MTYADQGALNIRLHEITSPASDRLGLENNSRTPGLAPGSDKLKLSNVSRLGLLRAEAKSGTFRTKQATVPGLEADAAGYGAGAQILSFWKGKVETALKIRFGL